MRTKKLNLLPLKALNVDDFFWNKYTGLVTKEIIPYQWKALNHEVADAEPATVSTTLKLLQDLKKVHFTAGYFRIPTLPNGLKPLPTPSPMNLMRYLKNLLMTQ